MRNSSHSPGCMRAFPASQSCQVRSVEDMSAAAAVWEIPASSLACRISAGVGLVDDKFFTEFFGVGFYVGVKELLIGIDRAVNFFTKIVVHQVAGGVHIEGFAVVFDFVGAHDFLRFAGLRRATHELNYTRNPCNSKSFLRKFNEAPTPPHRRHCGERPIHNPCASLAGVL